jgi:hypothetical protein
MIELYTVKDLLSALKEAGLSYTRPKFNWYESQGLIPTPTYVANMHRTNYFNNNKMRLYTKEEIANIIVVIRQIEKK